MKQYVKPKFLVAGVVGVLVAASGLFFIFGGAKNTSTHSSLPSGIVPGPAGIVGGSLVGNGQNAWVITNTGSAANAQYLSTSTGKIGEIIPTSINATSITVAGKNSIAVGAATPTAGFVEFFNTLSKNPMGTIPTAGPVVALARMPNSTSLYAMIATPTSKAIQILNPLSMSVSRTSLPLPSDAVSFTVSADGSSIVVLKSSGQVTYVSTTTGKITQTFQVGADPVAVAVNASGTRLYVLKGVETMNVAIIDTSTEAVLRATAAPKNARAIAITADGASIVNFVGTSAIGNIQSFSAN